MCYCHIEFSVKLYVLHSIIFKNLKYQFQEPERVILTLILHPLRREKGEIQGGYSYYFKVFYLFNTRDFYTYKASLGWRLRD
jgi:hypothetical protein